MLFSDILMIVFFTLFLALRGVSGSNRPPPFLPLVGVFRIPLGVVGLLEDLYGVVFCGVFFSDNGVRLISSATFMAIPPAFFGVWKPNRVFPLPSWASLRTEEGMKASSVSSPSLSSPSRMKSRSGTVEAFTEDVLRDL